MASHTLKSTQDSQLSFVQDLPSLIKITSPLFFLCLQQYLISNYIKISRMKNILSLLILAGLATAYTGDLTYYSAGLGSCGLTSTDSDAIVALSVPMVRIK